MQTTLIWAGADFPGPAWEAVANLRVLATRLSLWLRCHPALPGTSDLLTKALLHFMGYSFHFALKSKSHLHEGKPESSMKPCMAIATEGPHLYRRRVSLPKLCGGAQVAALAQATLAWERQLRLLCSLSE